MYAWLCRVMALIFTFNILSPAYAQTPLPRSGRSSLPRFDRSPREIEAARRADAAGASLDSLINSRDQYLNEYMAEYDPAMDAFLSAGTQAEINAAYQKLDQLHRTGNGVTANYQSQIAAAVKEQLDAQNAVTFEYYIANPHLAPDAISQTMGRDMRSPIPQRYILTAYVNNLLPRSYNCPSSQDFLDKLKNNKFENMEEMLDYLDPLGLHCRDYLVVAYAAETLYYGLEEFARGEAVPDEQREELKVFFSHVQYRAAASLARLNKVKAQTEELYMARGTLRILLAMLDNINQANPGMMFEKTICFMSPTQASWESYKKEERKKWDKQHPTQTRGNMTTRTEYQAVPLNYGDGMRGFSFKPITKTEMSIEVIATRPPAAISYEDFVQNNAYFLESCPEELPQGWKAEEVTNSTLQDNNAAWTAAANAFSFGATRSNLPQNAVLAPMAVLGAGSITDLGQEFINELQALKEKGSNAESKEAALLQLDMQYAAQFGTLLGDTQFLSRLVSMFEETPGKNIHGEYTQHRATDFNTKYSAVLSVLFNSVYETLNGFNVSNTLGAFEFLKEMAGPSHATDTRVLALGTLSMLTQPTDSMNEQMLRTESVSNDGEQTIKHWLSFEDRFNMSKYVADIYAPMQNESTFGMVDYGLNSEQMLALSDQLVRIYMGFLPLPGPTVTLGPCMRVEKMDTENLQTLTQSTFIQQRQGWYIDGNCQQHYTKGGTFVFSSSRPVEMLLDNRINWKKKNDEITNKGMEILGEALFWVFGGEIIGGAFCGLRLLWGASKALPRAIRAGKIVYNTSKGTRVYRATAAVKRMQGSLKVGSKYMSNYNFNTYLARNGMSIETELFGSSAGRATTTAVGLKLPPSPVGRITFSAADATTGAARGMSLPLFPGAPSMAKWTIQDRVFSLRVAQRLGLRNTWTAADRFLWQENMMFSSFEASNPFRLIVENEVYRNPFTGTFISGPRVAGFEGLDFSTGALLSEYPALKAGLTAYGNTLRFFAGWKAGDIATGILYRDSFNRWMMRKQQEAVDAETAQYDALSPESAADLETLAGASAANAAPGDIMTQVGGAPKESFSWLDALTLPSWAWQKIAPSEADAFDGSLILPPFMGGKYALSQMGIGSDPFMTDATRSQILVAARRMELSQARIGQVDTQLDTAVDSILAEIEQAQGEVSAMFTTLKQQFPGDWSAEEQAYRQFYNEYAAEVKELAKITNLQERSNRLTAVNAKYEQRSAELSPLIERKQNAILLANIAPEGEEAFWASYAASLQDIKGQMLFILPSDVPEAIRSSFLAEYGAIVDSALGKVRTLSQKKTAFTDKLAELERVAQEMNDKVERLSQKYSDYLTPAEPTFSDSFFSGDESQQAY